MITMALYNHSSRQLPPCYLAAYFMFPLSLTPFPAHKYTVVSVH